MPRDPRESTSEHKRGDRYKPTISRDDLKEARAQAAGEARRDMITEQLVEDQKQISEQLTDISKTMITINTDLAAGRVVMESIKEQADHSTQTAEANTRALLDHMNNHPHGGTSALDRKTDSWIRPIAIQVAGALATAALLGGLYASFFMKATGKG